MLDPDPIDARPNDTPPATAPDDTPVDVAIVGAGAAGIGAARACLAAGLTVTILEARDRVGGRAVTAQFGGHAIDLGAHWLHAGRLNPLVRLGSERGENLRRSPGAGEIVLNGRRGTREHRRLHGRAFDQADRAFAAAAREPTDRSIAAAMPPLGRWRAAIEATMALISGRPLHEVSAADFPSDEFGDNYFVAGGYGAYLARLSAGLPIRLATPVTSIDWSGTGVVLGTPHRAVSARCAIVTVPVPVLAHGAVAFSPQLPAGTAHAIDRFLAGTYEHVILSWPDAPVGGRDTLVKVTGRGGHYGMLTYIDDAPFHYFELDHETVLRAGARPGGLARFARTFLRAHFGARATRSLRVLCVTDWRRDPWARCSWAVVPPGEVAIRGALAAPVGERIWFAGEATSRAMWGTLGGAWEEGARAAGEAIERLRVERRAGSVSRAGENQ